MAIKTVAFYTICPALKRILFLLWTKISLRMRIASVSTLLHSAVFFPKQCDLTGMSWFDDDAFTLTQTFLGFQWSCYRDECPAGLRIWKWSVFSAAEHITWPISEKSEIHKSFQSTTWVESSLCQGNCWGLSLFFKVFGHLTCSSGSYRVAFIELCRLHKTTAGYKLRLQGILYAQHGKVIVQFKLLLKTHYQPLRNWLFFILYSNARLIK